jgi:mannose-6-phosphate isomerase-like protein (cupin superfamily)
LPSALQLATRLALGDAPAPALPVLGAINSGMGATIVRPHDGKQGHLGGIGVRFMAWAAQTGGGFSLVEHPMAPRALAAPLHRHANEDEYSYVLEGRMGAQLGDEVVRAEAGDLVFKPRGQWHSFWNAGDEPCRILEIISPGGFERYFEELVDLGARPAPEAVAEIAARYGLEFDMASIPALCERHGLRFPA